MKKKVLKTLRLVANKLPPVFYELKKTRYEYRKGSSLIADGINKVKGEDVDPAKYYQAQINRAKVNHYRKLKDAYKKGGQAAVIEYIEQVKKNLTIK